MHRNTPKKKNIIIKNYKWQINSVVVRNLYKILKKATEFAIFFANFQIHKICIYFFLYCFSRVNDVNFFFYVVSEVNEHQKNIF